MPGLGWRKAGEKLRKNLKGGTKVSFLKFLPQILKGFLLIYNLVNYIFYIISV
jgi:hypothetical protein